MDPMMEKMLAYMAHPTTFFGPNYVAASQETPWMRVDDVLPETPRSDGTTDAA